MHQPRPIFQTGRPAAVLLSRCPTQYVNVHPNGCPANCCEGDGPEQKAEGKKRPTNFPLDPIRDFYFTQNQLIPNAEGNHLSTTSAYPIAENDELEPTDEEENNASKESSTQSLLVWRQRQHRNLHLRRQQKIIQPPPPPAPTAAASNGAILRLEHNSRYSTPWWSLQDDSPLRRTVHQAAANAIKKRCSSSTSAESGGSICSLATQYQQNKSGTANNNSRAQPQQQRCCLFPWLIGALILLSIGLLFWTVILCVRQQWALEQRLMDTQEPYHRELKENVAKQNETSAALMGLFNGTRIRQTLHWVASRVHVAGTIEQLELMDKLAQEYRSLGFEVEKFEYPQVLLSNQDYARPNTIHAWNERRQRWELLSDGVGRLLKAKSKQQQQLHNVVEMDEELKHQLDSEDSKMHVWWNAYAGNGTTQGQLVYANYGTSADFETLKKANISIEGKIVLMRYGDIFRGEKVHLAEGLGAVGAILYSDPFDYVPGNRTFPDDLWLPPSGSQRGTLYRGIGDPETPGLPSLPYAHRQFNEEGLRQRGRLPNIPVTSIGYSDAQKLFERMDGQPVTWSRWVGTLPVVYRLAGSTLFRLSVNTRNERRTIRNFVAKMPGKEEPDRWVLLGNHADAWTKGSIDPGTGTAVMLEMARVLSEYAKGGWQPRRTIVFCQWDAEEFGLIGSTEWVEQHLRVLQQRAVAYINVDNFNGNTTLSVKAVPLLYRLLAEAASRVPQPVTTELDKGRRTLLDSWHFHNPRTSLPGDRSIPFIQFPHSGSDFVPFLVYAAIPVADLRMENVPYSYMLYHTAYEVPWLNENFLDPAGETSVALGRFWLEIVRQLADNMMIPFNVQDYSVALADYVGKAEAQLGLIRIGSNMAAKFASLRESIMRFQKVAIEFQRIIQMISSGEKAVALLQREQLNRRLMGVERCFLLDHPPTAAAEEAGRTAFRHAIFSAPTQEMNSNSALPFLLDPAAKWLIANRSNNGAEADKQVELMGLAFAWLHYCVECATQMLAMDGK